MSTWNKPELVVVMRRKPEEAVLSMCKEIGSPGSPNDEVGGCQYIAGGCMGCNFPMAS
jgi:hypothetical protein